MWTDGTGEQEWKQRRGFSLQSQSGFRQWLDGRCRIRWHESSVVHCSLCNDLFVQRHHQLYGRLLKSRPFSACNQVIFVILVLQYKLRLLQWDVLLDELSGNNKCRGLNVTWTQKLQSKNEGNNWNLFDMPGCRLSGGAGNLNPQPTPSMTCSSWWALQYMKVYVFAGLWCGAEPT